MPTSRIPALTADADQQECSSPTARSVRSAALSSLLRSYSIEVTSIDASSIAVAGQMLPAGSEVFIVSLPKDAPETLIFASVKLRRLGLIPVPHIVARNIDSPVKLKSLLQGLAEEAGIDRALILGGDRDLPSGSFDQSLQLLETGYFSRFNIRKLYLACYPEGHPRIPSDSLINARTTKLAAAQRTEMDVTLLSQFCFSAEPVLQYARAIRSQGVTVPFRVGVAGPASRARLMKFAIMCGIGPSLRVLKEREHLASNMLSGATPHDMLEELAMAQSREPELGISGIHFFTFGSVAKTIEFTKEATRMGA